jgi:hypothetical protein
VRALRAAVALIVCMGADRAGNADVLRPELVGAEQRLAARFASRRLPYPPRGIALVALKSEARLELWADAGEGWQFVRSYLIRRASRAGPKLRKATTRYPKGTGSRRSTEEQLPSVASHRLSERLRPRPRREDGRARSAATS